MCWWVISLISLERVDGGPGRVRRDSKGHHDGISSNVEGVSRVSKDELILHKRTNEWN